ncbi:hypothetical protein BCR33DRAFT_718526 [Rhizoclosmatium globosum]|uniref:Efficient mitochondria targeting-associated protein 19 n=1 Tax=Rhizoclosmatium globosum TaxID=329046 RepID=A0A1Y2C498_9FUNG|nr:hypothetical protein BCR33DRAFT_718526 [Rhizoclosmatium globosum]|eukprot:ORY41849.1 hypothetical protein BCR33DRAFT_718526 [Rhizoclosmatium globosum]
MSTIRRPLSSRPGDIAIILFFILHIPITILMATQIILPEFTAAYFPSFAIQAAQDYIRDSQDFLVMERALWFQSTVWCEWLVQFPFYVYLIYALVVDSKHVRTAGIVYATHTCTILVPIVYEMVFAENGIQTPAQKMQTVSVYSIWFILPFFILVGMIWRKGPVEGKKAKKE